MRLAIVFAVWVRANPKSTFFHTRLACKKVKNRKLYYAQNLYI